MMSFLLFLIAGLVAGWLAGQIMKGRGLGLWINLLMGVAGSFIGGFLFNFLGIGGEGIFVSLMAALIGAIILPLIINPARKKEVIEFLICGLIYSLNVGQVLTSNGSNGQRQN